MIGVGKMAKKHKKILLKVEEATEMLAPDDLDIAQLLAGWVIKEIESRRQNAEIALTTKDPSVTIVHNENQPCTIS
jgi:hypothetical protein